MVIDVGVIFSEQHYSGLRDQITKQLSPVDGTPRFHVDPAAVSGARGRRSRLQNAGLRGRPGQADSRSNQARGQNDSAEPRPPTSSDRRVVGGSLI
jgi:hypothetical protein